MIVGPLHFALAAVGIVLVVFYCALVVELDREDASSRNHFLWYIAGAAISFVGFLMLAGAIIYRGLQG